MKDKLVAALLAFFLGSLGIHKFYLNRSVQGVFYLLFFWTCIPGILGVFECVRFLLMSSEKFNDKYNSDFYIENSYSTIEENIQMKLSDSVDANLDVNQEEKESISVLPEPNINRPKTKVNVPYWGLSYVYSFNDIKTANTDALNFYIQFKDSFLNKDYIFLTEDEMNYAFVLLFDFEREFLNTNDYSKLRSNYNILVQHYPKTRIYCSQKLNLYKNIKRSTNIEEVTQSASIQDFVRDLIQEVPYWNSGYIYSNEQITFAGKEIQVFYSYFKRNFKNKSYTPLEQNNLGYAFTLMFDLEQEYQDNKDYFKLQSYYNKLEELYPKVRKYTSTILVKYNSHAPSNSYGNLIQNNSFESHTNYKEQDYYVGNQLKDKFELSPKQVRYLNRIGFYQETVFNKAEFCFFQQGLVYCRVIDTLEKHYNKGEATLSARVDEIAGLLKKYDSSQYYSSYYSQGVSLKSYKQEVYRILFKLTENKLREFYHHKRKLNIGAIHSRPEAIDLFEELYSTFEESLQKEVKLCEPANLESELVLNKQNTTRWKIYFECILKYIDNPTKFKLEIDQLAEFNRDNPSIENIFYEASKHIAKQDQLLALEYYLRYIEADLVSVTINNKSLNKTTLKVLFNNQEQLDQFNLILNNFLKTKDFEIALNGLQGIYKVKRKKIKLDLDKISDVKKQLDETVELLNEYLEEEVEELDTSLLEQLVTKPKQENLFNQDLGYTIQEIELLQMIHNFNNEITRELVEEFASENGMFVDSLLNNINEKTYELIDDNLIEEQEDTYTIEEQYYQNILK